VPTVRKWQRRYERIGPSGLLAQSRARHHQPQKTPANVAAQLVGLRKTLPTFGSRRLIREFDLRIGHNALDRIWREHGLMEKRRRKYQKKQGLAHIKARWALFQQISADTKDLDDIPRYWRQAQRLHLPVIQYTAREIRSGLLFWALAQVRSASASAVFASRIQQHLDRYGVSLRDLVWQTITAASSKVIFPKHSATASTCASHQPRTPTRATWRPCIAWKKTSFSISKTSPAAEISSPRCTPISCTSTSCVPIPTKKT
jgi:transposase